MKLGEVRLKSVRSLRVGGYTKCGMNGFGADARGLTVAELLAPEVESSASSPDHDPVLNSHRSGDSCTDESCKAARR